MEFEFVCCKRHTAFLPIAKALKAQPISKDRVAVLKNEKKMKTALKKAFKKLLPIAIEKLTPLMKKVEKASKIDSAIDDIINSDAWDDLVPDASVVIGSMTKSGAKEALKQVGSDADVSGPVTRWAENRAAELVGKKMVDGELVDNPNAKWAITDSTREMLQAMVADAIDQGMSSDEFASALEDSFAFSSQRAEMISRTEMAMADSAGQMQGWSESGVVTGTMWTTAEDDKVSDECNENANAGVVAIGDTYPSGDEAPPAHPNCRCALVPVLEGE